jgi:hypothetical protein
MIKCPDAFMKEGAYAEGLRTAGSHRGYSFRRCGVCVQPKFLRGVSLKAKRCLKSTLTGISPPADAGLHQVTKLLQSGEAAPVPEILGNPVIDRERLAPATQQPPRAGTTRGGVPHCAARIFRRRRCSRKNRQQQPTKRQRTDVDAGFGIRGSKPGSGRGSSQTQNCIPRRNLTGRKKQRGISPCHGLLLYERVRAVDSDHALLSAWTFLFYSIQKSVLQGERLSQCSGGRRLPISISGGCPLKTSGR